MSTHEVKVVRIEQVLPHPNADKLELIPIGGYQAISAKGNYKPGDLAVYIEPDYVVPDVPEFSFLGGRRRIGAKRLRGLWSEGLLINAPEGAVEGQDVMQSMGIERWEPPTHGEPRSWFGVKGPPLGCIETVPEFIKAIPKYDLENLKKHAFLFTEGEPVIVTEKLHGTNARYVFHDGQMYCGSRTQWRKSDPTNVYWEALKQNPFIEAWCRANPDVVLLGEIFGWVQDLRYGAKEGEYRFAAFDAWHDGLGWVPTDMETDLQRVPVVAMMPFSMEKLKELAEKDSFFGGVSEGLVVQPLEERHDPRHGRVKMKLVSNRYLSR